MSDVPQDALLRTCLHECAHLALARHFGACGFVTIATVLDASGARRHAGRFQMFGELDGDAWRIVALAGAVAECLAEEPDATLASVSARLDGDASPLSGVDFDLASGYEARHVDECLSLVRSLWQAILSDGEALARERRSGSR